MNLTGLTKNKRYDYMAYSAPYCLKVLAIGRARFSTTDAGVGNLTKPSDGYCGIGPSYMGPNKSCAVSFTTGDDTDGGYFLNDVSVPLSWEIGNLGGLSVALRAADANGNPASQDLAALSGSASDWGGFYTFSCAGGGLCDLSKNTTYFIVLSAPNASFGAYRGWETRNSGFDYGWPSSDSWAMGNGGKIKEEWHDYWTDLESGHTPIIHLTAGETSAGLSVSAVSSTRATLGISGHTGTWHYRANHGPHSSSCASETTASADVTGLQQATYYVYTAYSDSACNTPIASAAFTTLTITLTASEITGTTATLEIAGHTGNWHYKHSGATDCSIQMVRSDIVLTGLTPATEYTFTAYSDNSCTEANRLATADAFTTEGLSVSNLGETAANDKCLIGSYFNAIQKCAQGFTTGSSAAGYTLHSATAKFADKLGDPGNFSVQLYDKSGSKPGSAVSGATFSGSLPETAGDKTYTCSGNGCRLLPDTEYFVVMSAAATTGNNHFSWHTTAATDETEIPSNNGWSIANNSWRGETLNSESTNRSNMMKLAATVNVGVVVSKKKETTATLTLGGYDGAWWYDANKVYTNCHSAGSGSSVDLTGLTAGTEYTFKAYSKSGCNSADEIASATFTTFALTTSNVTATSATLTLAGQDGSWYYKRQLVANASCSSEQTGTTANLTGLTPGTSYTYAAYSDSGCASAVAIGSSFTTGGVSVSNLHLASGLGNCGLGYFLGENKKCGLLFETGSESKGYTLHSVTARFSAKVGSPTGFSVDLYSASGNNPGSAITTATFNGDAPATAGDYTYTCSGDGCELAASTKYYVVMSTTNTSGSHYYNWKHAASGAEAKIPSNNGWSMGDGSKQGPNLHNTNQYPTYMKVAATVNP